MAQTDLLLARPVSVVTPVHSSLAGMLRDYLEGLFPQGYFRDFFVSTEMSARPGSVLRGRFRPMTGSNLSQRRYPMLSVRVDASAEQSQLDDLDSYWRAHSFLRRPSGLCPIFRDETNWRRLGCQTERMICRFGITVLAETDLQGMEILHYLKRTMPIDRSVYLRDRDIWTEIPGDVLKAIWWDMGLGDGSDPADMAAFAAYLRSQTAGAVNQALNSATGRYVFSFSYSANPVMKVAGAPSFSVSREGGVVRYSQVDFGVELDAVVPISYAYEQAARARPPARPHGEPPIGSEGGHAYFGLSVRLAPPTTLNGNLSLVYYIGLITGAAPENLPRADDVTDLGGSIEPRLKRYIVHLLSQPDPASLIQLVVRCENRVVDPAGYSFDFANWRITLGRGEVRYNESYYVAFYCDVGDYESFEPGGGEGGGQAPSPYYVPPGSALPAPQYAAAPSRASSIPEVQENVQHIRDRPPEGRGRRRGVLRRP